MPAEPPEANILALHGFTGVGADFAPFAEMCGGFWHCPDLPGHGTDPQIDCTPEATRRSIDSQVSSLSPQPSVLLGYSMGARAALLHAVEYPDNWDALILISPNPGIKEDASRAERRAIDEKLAQRIEDQGVEAFIQFWQNTPMIRSQKKIRADWLEAMQSNRWEHTAAGLAASLRQFGQGSCPNTCSELEKLAMPTLLITGAEDRKYTRIAERMHKHLRNGVLKIVVGVGHMPHLENPEICADIIGDFLNELS